MCLFSRREILRRCGTGLGMLALAGLLADGKELVAEPPAPEGLAEKERLKAAARPAEKTGALGAWQRVPPPG